MGDKNTHSAERRNVLKLLGGTGLAALSGYAELPQSTKEWFKEAAKPFQGQTISLVTEATPASLFYKSKVKEFQELTGINVEFSAVSWGKMYNKEVSHASANEPGLDIGYIEQDTLAAYAQKGWLTDLTKFRKQNQDLAMPGFDVQGFVPFASNFRFPTQDDPLYAYPMESFLKILTYRQDLYQNEDLKSAYKEEHGEELTVPQTPEQYRKTAKFFTETAPDVLGKEIYGHGAQVKGVTGPYAMVESYWPMFGVYNWGLNTQKWTALKSRDGGMNSQAAIDGLKFYKEMLQYAPEGVKNYGFSGPADALISGTIAQGLVYGENLARMVEADKPYQSSGLETAVPPAKQSAMEAAKAGDGYIGYFDGGGWGILSSSKKKKPAYLFIQYLLRPGITQNVATEATALVRSSDIKEVEDSKVNKATNYFNLYQEDADLFKGNPVGQVQLALMQGPVFKWFHRFVAGEVSAERAANMMAWNTEQMLFRMGYLGSTLDEKPFGE